MLKFEQIKYKETIPKCIDYHSDGTYERNYRCGKFRKTYECSLWTECKNYNFDLCRKIKRQL